MRVSSTRKRRGKPGNRARSLGTKSSSDLPLGPPRPRRHLDNILLGEVRVRESSCRRVAAHIKKSWDETYAEFDQAMYETYAE